MPWIERIPPPFQGGTVVWIRTQGVALGFGCKQLWRAVKGRRTPPPFQGGRYTWRDPQGVALG
jgi:hypothetical protein